LSCDGGGTEEEELSKKGEDDVDCGIGDDRLSRELIKRHVSDTPVSDTGE